MRKIMILAALAGSTAAFAIPASASKAGPEGVTVNEDGVTIDTGIRCVTEPCPSHVTITFPKP